MMEMTTPIRTLAGLLASAAMLLSQTRYESNWASIDARESPRWFGDAKFGIFIHWGVYSVPAYAAVGSYAEWYWNSLEEGRAGKTTNKNALATWNFHQANYGPDFPYANFAPMFRAELFQPDHWADVFLRSGAKYVVLTSKHHEGFTLWPSAEADRTWGRPWNATAVGPKRDLLGDLTASVRKAGLRMGIYYSLYEWYNPLWLSDKQKYVEQHMFPQFKDVVTRYKPSIIFSDGEWDLPSTDWRSAELLSWLFNESPVRDEVVVDDRWGKDTRHKHGGYWTTEYTPGLQGANHSWEESRGMGFSYGYNRAETLKDYRTTRELILMLTDIVSRGGNLLLDIGPTADGRIPVVMEERLTQMGQWLKINGEAIYGTREWKKPRQWSEGAVPEFKNSEFMTRYEVDDFISKPKPSQAVIQAFFTQKDGAVYAIVPGWPGKRFTVHDISMASNARASLLGYADSLHWKAVGDGIELEMPEMSADRATAQYAYVIKLEGAK
jgi:alpha-L-fucosidase